MALSEIDRNLLARCLAKKPDAWKDFVDRYTGLVIHVIHHSAQSRSLRISPEDREDLASEVFLEIVRNDFALLRHFRGESSLATYLTVVARRVVVHELLKRKKLSTLAEPADGAGGAHHENGNATPIERMKLDRPAAAATSSGLTIEIDSVEVGMKKNITASPEPTWVAATNQKVLSGV